MNLSVLINCKVNTKAIDIIIANPGSVLPLTTTKNNIAILKNVLLNKFLINGGSSGPNKTAYKPINTVIIVDAIASKLESLSIGLLPLSLASILSILLYINLE